MKHIIILFLTVSSTVAFAQNKFGIAGGMQLTGLHSKDHFNNFPDPRISFRIGGFYERTIREKYGIRTELSYSLAGGKGIDNRLDVSYLSIPILFYYKPIKQLQVHLGPEVNIFLGNSATRTFYNSKDFKPLDIGISVGSEFRISKFFGLSVRNYFGLIHATEYNRDENLPIQDGDQLTGDGLGVIKYNRNNIFQLSVSYYISE